MTGPMATTTKLAPVPRAAPDYSSRAYWAGTIKMSLSKFFILRALHERPMHGYDIARAVESISNGCCSPTEGTIYPVLREFEEGGYVEVESEVVSGRQRKTYTLTEKGREAFQVGLQAWMDVTRTLIKTERATKRESTGCCS